MRTYAIYHQNSEQTPEGRDRAANSQTERRTAHLHDLSGEHISEGVAELHEDVVDRPPAFVTHHVVVVFKEIPGVFRMNKRF